MPSFIILHTESWNQDFNSCLPCIPHIQLCVLILIFSPTSFHRKCLTITQCDLWYVTKVWEIKQWKKYIVLGESIWCVIANNNFMYYIKHIFFLQKYSYFLKAGLWYKWQHKLHSSMKLGHFCICARKKKKNTHTHSDVYTYTSWCIYIIHMGNFKFTGSVTHAS